MPSTRRLRLALLVPCLMVVPFLLLNCGGGGSDGDNIKGVFFAPLVDANGQLISLTAQEVDIIIRRAAAAVDAPNMIVAVVDRVGRPLGIWSRNPAPTTNDVNIALSIARTGAFMSSSQGPITSRTLAYISTFHFPPQFSGVTRNPIPTSPFTLDATLASQPTTAGVAGTPQGPLWQIFSSNRGAPFAGQDLLNSGLPAFTNYSPPTNGFTDMRIPSPSRVDGSGNPVFGVAGTGLTYLAGGIPIYKAGDTTQLPPDVPIFGFPGPNGQPQITSNEFPTDAALAARVVGSVGVYITDAMGNPMEDVAEYAAMRSLQSDAAAAGGSGLTNLGVPAAALANPLAELNLFLPFEIVPAQGGIFLVGQLLPYVNQTSLPAGSAPGVFADDGVNGLTLLASSDGGEQPFGWIIGPDPDPLGNLSVMDVQQIVNQGIASANGTRAAIRLPLGTPTQMVFAITNLEGRILGAYRMEDAPIFSYDVSITKARCVTYLSSYPGGTPDMHPADAALLNAAGIPTGIPGTAGEFGVAITTRTLAFGTQPFFPPGIDGALIAPGPLFPFASQNADPAQFNRMANAAPSPGLQSGIIFFPGAAPLYKNGQLVGGFGVSGDGVEQDDFVTAQGYAGFEPPNAIRVDNFTFDGVRWPYFKFPQLPGPGSGN